MNLTTLLVVYLGLRLWNVLDFRVFLEKLFLLQQNFLESTRKINLSLG